jgi:hypothetical protein
MIRALLRSFVIAPLLAASCGGSPPPPAPSPPAATAEATAAAPAEAPASEDDKPGAKLPSECAEKGKLCLPPAAFVKRLCSTKVYPDVALAMHAKGTPWSRGYLRVKSAEAWYASGGVSSGDKMIFEEEFVLLARREANTGGMTVSGAGGAYDVLRWDGTCASLQDEEVSLTGSSTPKTAKVVWKSLDDKVRDALLADEKINKVFTARRKECKGATMGDVTKKCEELDDKLSAVVVEYVRRGGTVPTPPTLP